MRTILATFVEKVSVSLNEVNVRIKVNFRNKKEGDNVRNTGAVRALSPVEYPVNFSREVSKYARNEYKNSITH